jgi:hypothetical protein
MYSLRLQRLEKSKRQRLLEAHKPGWRPQVSHLLKLLFLVAAAVAQAMLPTAVVVAVQYFMKCSLWFRQLLTP